MNIDLIRSLILKEGCAINDIHVSYDVMPCSYFVELTLISTTGDEIEIRKAYDDDESGLKNLGSDFVKLGEIFRDTTFIKKEES